MSLFVSIGIPFIIFSKKVYIDMNDFKLWKLSYRPVAKKDPKNKGLQKTQNRIIAVQYCDDKFLA